MSLTNLIGIMITVSVASWIFWILFRHQEESDQPRSDTDDNIWAPTPSEAEDPSVLGLVRSNLRVYFGARIRELDHGSALAHVWASRYVHEFGADREAALDSASRQLDPFLAQYNSDSEYQHLARLIYRMHRNEGPAEGFPIEKERLGSTLLREAKRFQNETNVQLEGID